jgi:hypothetical protein
MGDIRSKSGLDYLTRSSAGGSGASDPGSEERLPRAGGNVSGSNIPEEQMQKALFTVGRAILIALRDTQGRKAELNQLVDITGIDKDELTPVVDKLADLNWITYIVRDKYGNHTVQITNEGLASV